MSKASSLDRKSTRLNSSHGSISYAVFCLKKKKRYLPDPRSEPPVPSRADPVQHRRGTLARSSRRGRQAGAAVSVPWVPIFLFFFNDTATTEIYTLSLHDALPI